MRATACAWGCVLALGVLSACGSDAPDDDSSAGADAGARDGGGVAATDSGPRELVEQECEIPDGAEAPDSLGHIGCRADFEALASRPLDDSIPGARSAKVVLDLADDDALYFQNSNKYPIHYDFASAKLSGGDLPPVGSFREFTDVEYYVAERRFLLGAVTHYEGPDVWAFEIAPYDTASPEMIAKVFRAVRDAAYFGPALTFHPTSQTVEQAAEQLPDDIPVTTTSELYEGIDYQPLNLGETIGRLRFQDAATLATSYLGFRDIVVLDRVPNDISVVAGLITEEFQTPLSHVNVLAQNRKTPNMGLKKATQNQTLRALEGKWVKLVVGAFEWSIEEVGSAEADAFWEEHKPAPIELPEVDLSVTDLRDIELVTEMAGPKVTRAEIAKAVSAFGAKAANYSVLTHIEGVPIKSGFAIPAYYYVQFMEENGIFDQLDQLLADPEFNDDPAVRDTKLAQLRDAIKAAPIGAELDDALRAKLDADYPGETMRFRSSTNAEDLDGFPCAGCYDSHTGDPADWEGDLLYAIRQTWATVFSYRTFEERAYHSIDHEKVAMSLLVHHNFPDEEANGVAITANPFDPSNMAPGFYVNVQIGGDAEVVAPPAGVTSDSFIYQHDYEGLPIIYLTHSNLIEPGTTVLTPRQVDELGDALQLIHDAFVTAYGPPPGSTAWYAMDVEFKFDDEAAPDQPPTLYIKQARPYPGRGM